MLEKSKNLLSEPKPPRLFRNFSDFGTLFVCFGLSIFACVAYFKQNWIGLGVDIAIITLNIIVMASRWRSNRSFYEYQKTVYEFDKILKTPSFREEGNSIILTALFPSPQLLADLEKIKKSLK